MQSEGHQPSTVHACRIRFPLTLSAVCPIPYRVRPQQRNMTVESSGPDGVWPAMALPKTLTGEQIPRTLYVRPWALSLSFCICKVHKPFKSFTALFGSEVATTTKRKRKRKRGSDLVKRDHDGWGYGSNRKGLDTSMKTRVHRQPPQTPSVL